MPRYLDYAERGELSPEVQTRNTRLRLYKDGPVPAFVPRSAEDESGGATPEEAPPLEDVSVSTDGDR